VHLRRALLLFAIVLGLAAIAASVSRPREEASDRSDSPASAPPSSTDRDPTVSPGSAPVSQPAAEVTLDATREQKRRISVRQPATVLVEVDEPGQVQIEELGLSGAADPLTPARFEVFATEPGRYELSFVAAGTDEEESAGTLVVESTEE
jgi:hypothetical protein